MDTSNLKNIVVLKDLPSNLVEEAIVVLKQNRKIPKLELIDKENKKKNVNNIEKKANNQTENSKDYIVKEAQMLLSEYILNSEKKNLKDNNGVQQLKKKYHKAKMLNYILAMGIVFMGLISFII